MIDLLHRGVETFGWIVIVVTIVGCLLAMITDVHPLGPGEADSPSRRVPRRARPSAAALGAADHPPGGNGAAGQS